MHLSLWLCVILLPTKCFTLLPISEVIDSAAARELRSGTFPEKDQQCPMQSSANGTTLAQTTIATQNFHRRKKRSIVAGTLKQDTHLSRAEAPFDVTSDILVPEGSTLTIDPGTDLHFSPSTAIIVRGSLVAKGTREYPIMMMPKTQGNKWRGLRFETAYKAYDARLGSALTENEGLLEVHNGVDWTFVCSVGWDLNDANVACKQMGFPDEAVAATISSSFRAQSSSMDVARQFWLSNVQCFGNESSLSQCKADALRQLGDCVDMAHVQCKGTRQRLEKKTGTARSLVLNNVNCSDTLRGIEVFGVVPEMIGVTVHNSMTNGLSIDTHFMDQPATDRQPLQFVVNHGIFVNNKQHGVSIKLSSPLEASAFNVSFEECISTANGQNGLFLSGRGTVGLKTMAFFGNGHDGLESVLESGSISLSNVLVGSNSRYGLKFFRELTTNPLNILVEKCNITGHWWDAAVLFSIGEGATITISGNRFWNNFNGALIVGYLKSDTLSVINNVFEHNRGNTVQLTETRDSNSILIGQNQFIHNYASEKTAGVGQSVLSVKFVAPLNRTNMDVAGNVFLANTMTTVLMLSADNDGLSAQNMTVDLSHNNLKDNNATVVIQLSLLNASVHNNDLQNPVADCELKTGRFIDGFSVDARNNFWGDQASQVAARRVCEYRNDAALLRADFEPFLSSPSAAANITTETSTTQQQQQQLQQPRVELNSLTQNDETLGGTISWPDAFLAKRSKPYSVMNNIVIRKTGGLVIEAGSVLQFATGRGITVEGQLIAKGNAQNGPVIFQGENGAVWSGIVFDNSEALANSQLAHCQINSAHIGITLNGGGEVSVKDCIIKELTAVGILVESQSAGVLDLDGSTILNSQGHGIKIANRSTPLRISNVNIDTTLRNAFDVRSTAAEISLRNVSVTNAGSHAVFAEQASFVDDFSLQISDSSFVSNNGLDVVYVSAKIFDRISVVNSHFSDNSASSIRLYLSCNFTMAIDDQQPQLTVSGNVFENNRNEVVSLDLLYCIDATLSGNEFVGNNLDRKYGALKISTEAAQGQSNHFHVSIFNNTFERNMGEYTVYLLSMSSYDFQGIVQRNMFNSNDNIRSVLIVDSPVYLVNWNEFRQQQCSQKHVLEVEYNDLRELNATRNFWGSEDDTTIERMIVDGRTIIPRGKAVFKPFLTRSGLLNGSAATNHSCNAAVDCFGHGSCLASGACHCDEGYNGNDCSKFSCVTLNNCSSYGYCIGPNMCSCFTGWSGNQCNVALCVSLQNCSGHGQCVSLDECKCDQGFTGISCNMSSTADTALRSTTLVISSNAITSPLTVVPTTATKTAAAATTTATFASTGNCSASNCDPRFGVCSGGSCFCVDISRNFETCSTARPKPSSIQLTSTSSSNMSIATEGVPYEVQLKTTDSNVRWRLINAPENMTVDAVSGHLIWLNPIGSQQPINVSMEAVSTAGATRTSWQLVVPVTYNATIDNIFSAAQNNATILGQSTALNVFGHVGSLANHSGSPNRSVPVFVKIYNNGNLIRDNLVWTNDNGSFSSDFYPSTAEAGHFSVVAVHPGIAKIDENLLRNAKNWSTFGIFATTTSDIVNYSNSSAASFLFTLQNIGAGNITGLRTMIVGNSSDVHLINVSFEKDRDHQGTQNLLLPGQSVLSRLSLTVQHNYEGPLLFQVSNDQLVTALVSATVKRIYSGPFLISEPEFISFIFSENTASASTGKVRITNQGSTSTGPLHLVLPSNSSLFVVSFESTATQQNSPEFPILATNEFADLTLGVTSVAVNNNAVGNVFIFVQNTTLLVIPYRVRLSNARLSMVAVTVNVSRVSEQVQTVPVFGARIKLASSTGESTEQFSNSHGLAVFQSVAVGQYSIQASASGYRTATEFVDIRENNTAFDLVLEFQPLSYEIRVEDNVAVNGQPGFTLSLTETFNNISDRPVLVVEPNELSFDEASESGLRETLILRNVGDGDIYGVEAPENPLFPVSLSWQNGSVPFLRSRASVSVSALVSFNRTAHRLAIREGYACAAYVINIFYNYIQGQQFQRYFVKLLLHLSFYDDSNELEICEESSNGLEPLNLEQTASRRQVMSVPCSCSAGLKFRCVQKHSPLGICGENLRKIPTEWPSPASFLTLVETAISCNFLGVDILSTHRALECLQSLNDSCGLPVRNSSSLLRAISYLELFDEILSDDAVNLSNGSWFASFIHAAADSSSSRQFISDDEFRQISTDFDDGATSDVLSLVKRWNSTVSGNTNDISQLLERLANETKELNTMAGNNNIFQLIDSVIANEIVSVSNQTSSVCAIASVSVSPTQVRIGDNIRIEVSVENRNAVNVQRLSVELEVITNTSDAVTFTIRTPSQGTNSANFPEIQPNQNVSVTFILATSQRYVERSFASDEYFAAVTLTFSVNETRNTQRLTSPGFRVIADDEPLFDVWIALNNMNNTGASNSSSSQFVASIKAATKQDKFETCAVIVQIRNSDDRFLNQLSLHSIELSMVANNDTTRPIHFALSRVWINYEQYSTALEQTIKSIAPDHDAVLRYGVETDEKSFTRNFSSAFSTLKQGYIAPREIRYLRLLAVWSDDDQRSSNSNDELSSCSAEAFLVSTRGQDYPDSVFKLSDTSKPLQPLAIQKGNISRTDTANFTGKTYNVATVTFLQQIKTQQNQGPALLEIEAPSFTVNRSATVLVAILPGNDSDLSSSSTQFLANVWTTTDESGKTVHHFVQPDTNIGGTQQQQTYRLIYGEQNTNYPEFPQQRYDVLVPSDAALNSTLARISATDKDNTGNISTITYDLFGGDGVFGIDPTTGDLKLLRPLPVNTNNFCLNAVAQDNGLPPKSTEVPVSVYKTRLATSSASAECSVFADNPETAGPSYAIAGPSSARATTTAIDNQSAISPGNTQQTQATAAKGFFSQRPPLLYNATTETVPSLSNQTQGATAMPGTNTATSATISGTTSINHRQTEPVTEQTATETDEELIVKACRSAQLDRVYELLCELGKLTEDHSGSSSNSVG